MCVCRGGGESDDMGGCGVGSMCGWMWVSSPLDATKDKVHSAAGVHTLKIPRQ